MYFLEKKTKKKQKGRFARPDIKKASVADFRRGRNMMTLTLEAICSRRVHGVVVWLMSVQTKIQIGKDLRNIGIQMFPRKRLANFSLILLASISSDPSSSRTFGRRGETLRELPIQLFFFSFFFFLHIPFSSDRSLPSDTYSFGTSRVRFLTRRPPSIRYPFTQSLTHSRAHLSVAISKQRVIASFVKCYVAPIRRKSANTYGKMEMC